MCRSYYVTGSLLPASQVEQGDLALKEGEWYLAREDDDGQPQWSLIQDGEHYPGDRLPFHVLALRPGRPPMWIKERTYKKIDYRK